MVLARPFKAVIGRGGGSGGEELTIMEILQLHNILTGIIKIIIKIIIRGLLEFCPHNVQLYTHIHSYRLFSSLISGAFHLVADYIKYYAYF